MKYVVLLSNGLYEHSFQLFKNIEQAYEYADKQTYYKIALIRELTESINVTI